MRVGRCWESPKRDLRTYIGRESPVTCMPCHGVTPPSLRNRRRTSAKSPYTPRLACSTRGPIWVNASTPRMLPCSFSNGWTRFAVATLVSEQTPGGASADDDRHSALMHPVEEPVLCVVCSLHCVGLDLGRRGRALARVGAHVVFGGPWLSGARLHDAPGDRVFERCVGSRWWKDVGFGCWPGGQDRGSAQAALGGTGVMLVGGWEAKSA